MNTLDEINTNQKINVVIVGNDNNNSLYNKLCFYTTYQKKEL